jgi:hypothetical protein
MSPLRTNLLFISGSFVSSVESSKLMSEMLLWEVILSMDSML